MREMDRRVGILRLLLADIADRERQAEEARSQLRGQLHRMVDFTVQYNGGVSNALAGMAEIEDRLRRQEDSLRHLALLRERARGELNALIVTRDVAEAQRRLSDLEAQRARLLSGAGAGGAGDGEAGDPHPDLGEIESEIVGLRAAIEAASAAAARSLAGSDREPPTT